MTTLVVGLATSGLAVVEALLVDGAPVGRLDKAWNEATRRDWLVVDMKRDWKVIFPFELGR